MNTVFPNAEFNRAVKAHLAEYKRNRLQVAENGVWAKNGLAYDHILPKPLQRLNIIESYRDEFWQEYEAGRLGGRFRLHPDFHHLNSSQALAFNLFYPFVNEDRQYLPALLASMGLRCDAVVCAQFEKVLDAAEKTNFDFYFEWEDGSCATVEVKYSENGFAGDKSGPECDERWDRIYRDRAITVFSESASTKEAFLKDYQLFRNLVYLADHPGSRALFVFPVANGAFGQLNAQLDAILRPECRERAVIIALEPLVEKLSAMAMNINDNKLLQHFAEFKQKYLEYPGT